MSNSGYGNIDVRDIERYLYNMGGIKGASRMIMAKAINYGLNQFKNKMGMDMTFSTDSEIALITNWVKENDKNFEKHIRNPYSLRSKVAVQQPILNGFFILPLRKDTYAFVKADYDSSMKEHGQIINVYLFGKKMFHYYKQIINKIDNTRSNNILYSISAVGDNKEGRWKCIGTTLAPRPMDTMFLDSGVKTRIINHLNTWIDNKDIYESRGLNYKTGILLYGKAGTGKSSLATAIATYLDCGLITIDTTTFQNLNIPEVVESINADTNRYVILIDEIDTLFKSRDDEDMSDQQKEKTAKLLSFLDSQQSPTNVVFVATTNYIDRLDSALLRKGRFDLVEELADINRDAAVDMCKSFNVPENKIDIIMNEKFKDSDTINPATLQSEILQILKN